MKVLRLCEANNWPKAMVELVVMVQNGWLLDAKEIQYTAAHSPQPVCNQDTLALLRRSWSAESASHLMDKLRRRIVRQGLEAFCSDCER
jgi:hypothetical protein